MTEIIVRDANENDAASIAELLTSLGYPRDAGFAARKLRELASHDSVRVFVAEVAGELVGVIGFEQQRLLHQDGNIGSIMARSVSEAHRGEGVGRRLIERVEEEARRSGCIKIAVASGIKRADAHAFYTRLGFEENTKRFVKQLE